MINGRTGAACVCAVAATLCLGGPAEAVKRTDVVVAGQKAFKYTWKDSAGLNRSVVLKKQGGGNSGNGGYAIQMIYQTLAGDGSRRTIVAKAPAGDGFGYFVSHERYRSFVSGAQETIARRIFNKDDSPLGRGFAVKTKHGADGAKFKSVTFRLTYPRYGTKAPGGIDANTGEDMPKLGLASGLYQLYDLPVSITWSFQDGRNYPRIRTVVDLSKVPGPDRVSFDLRGPYGKLDFDVGANVVSQLHWGDRFHFNTVTFPLTRNSQWVWNQANAGARYSALVSANSREMGLLEPRLYSKSEINDGFAFGRGKTYATHDAGQAGCPGQELPCDYEWPYQSSQYELPYDNPNGTTTSEKMAWGSTPFYGMTIPSTWDGVAGTPFDGWPANRKIKYDVCVVLGETVAGGLTRFVAEGGGRYDCAKAD